jgi:hypothetical protein
MGFGSDYVTPTFADNTARLMQHDILSLMQHDILSLMQHDILSLKCSKVPAVEGI